MYYYGSDTNSARTYNYNSGTSYHLANQNQKICVRRERGNCKICWYHGGSAIDFNISGGDTSNGKKLTCCGYGADGKQGNKDCVIIPSASKTTGALIGMAKGFCGANLATADDSATDKTICCKYQFYVKFIKCS